MQLTALKDAVKDKSFQKAIKSIFQQGQLKRECLFAIIIFTNDLFGKKKAVHSKCIIVGKIVLFAHVEIWMSHCIWYLYSFAMNKYTILYLNIDFYLFSFPLSGMWSSLTIQCCITVWRLMVNENLYAYMPPSNKNKQIPNS